MNRPALPLIILLLACFAVTAQTAVSGERASLNNGWRFSKGDPTQDAGKLDYSAIKNWVEATGAQFTTNADLAAKIRPDGDPGGEISCAQNNFDDSSWRLLNLPHDWGIEGAFKQEYQGDTGKLPWWGVAWYRKHVQIPSTDQGRRICLDIDGAMSYATVWLNGHFIGGWPYGYASFRIDLTPGIKFGADNVIAIRLDNPKNSSRWYPGGGIYRNVWLVKSGPVHVAHWGTYLTTPQVTPDSAAINVRVTVANDSDAERAVIVKNEIFDLGADDARGASVTKLAPGRLTVAPEQTGSTEIQGSVERPRLWNIGSPQRYLLVTSIEQDGKLLDSYETPFGIRTIQFTADKGFLLNGRRVPIYGVCDHHDLGALGAAINVSALARQIRILKEMGCNAIRTSHNPPAPELLDLCDRMGMLVMDESFDCWKRGKTRNDYHLLFDDWHEKDWRAELRRDRNHPCIILWSIGNEIAEQGSEAGHQIAGELTRIAHEEDPTRPTSAACNNTSAGYNGFQNNVDVFGYNYKPQEYAKFRMTYPDKPLFGSETASCISSRGEYFFPVSMNKDDGKADFQMSSYDLYAPPWATTPDAEFKGQDGTPSVCGEFVWTGFDYLGEPTPYGHDSTKLLTFTDPVEKARAQKELDELGHINVPSRSSYFGIVDLAGFKKDRFYLYQARWRPALPMAHILPHWNWPDRVGQVTPVHVYTSGDEAELFLNGKSQGRKKKEPLEYRIHWDDVVYQPGELRVVAYKDGVQWATDVVKTTGAPAELLLEADRPIIRPDGHDLCYVTITVADKHDLTVPKSKNRVKLEVDGPGELVATDNGDATSFESFQSPERNAFNGMALAIVRAKPGATGVIRLRATSPGLKEATIKITAR